MLWEARVSRNNLTAQVIRGARSAGSALAAAADWLADRLEDATKWAANLVRYLPTRIWRLAHTIGVALAGLITFLPTGVRVLRRGGRGHFGAWGRARVRQGAIRSVQMALEALDIIGVPEIFAFVWRLLTRATPLTGNEIVTAATILGPTALRFHDVRVAQGGLLNLVFRRNGGRAFVTFHTVNLPGRGDHSRENLDIVLHELVHVLQYERAGSRYLAEALVAQHGEGYGYGGPAGLLVARDQGKRLRNFNREQQAQIAQDYYMHLGHGWDTAAFEPYIEELRAGDL